MGSLWFLVHELQFCLYGVLGIGESNGNVRIAGVPVIGASWVTNDKALIIDANYLERVETEGLRVEFSYEDSDNFQRNLVTARVECFEDINIMRTDAIIYGSF